ncbi:MAG: hypothetical protein KAH56_02085 [Candidatus Krumholzibacteria bacterium]|nr:hypothetical protein [Candidatus Krumholzibacteria bacterium]
MRILINLAFATVLVLAASVAGAADLPQQSANSASFQDNSHVLGSPGITTLQLSSMYVEIQAVLNQADKTEQLLLKELAAATEDDDVDRIIHRIERLEVDRTLTILKIQVRYARSEERWDVVYRLRARIMEILENEAYVLK